MSDITPQPQGQQLAKPAVTNFGLIKNQIDSQAFKDKIKQFLGETAPAFVSNSLSVINNSKLLKDAVPETVYSAVLTAATLGLSLDKNTGYAYIIPFKNNRTNIVEAQFQIGWKGLVQLALKSSQLSKINVTDVREGELKAIDRMTGDINFEWVQSESERNKLPTIGYLAYVKLTSGFEKMLYLSVEEAKEHGRKYSKTYNSADSKWVTEFDSMAKKTVLKRLLMQYVPLETLPTVKEALKKDQAVIRDGNITYPDNPEYTEVEEVESSKNASQEAINGMKELFNK